MKFFKIETTMQSPAGLPMKADAHIAAEHVCAVLPVKMSADVKSLVRTVDGVSYPSPLTVEEILRLMAVH